jgi:hypothetical protein
MGLCRQQLELRVGLCCTHLAGTLLLRFVLSLPPPPPLTELSLDDARRTLLPFFRCKPFLAQSTMRAGARVMLIAARIAHRTYLSGCYQLQLVADLRSPCCLTSLNQCRYQITGSINLPSLTVLRGAGIDRTFLWWDDDPNATMNTHLIGSNLTYPCCSYAVEDLTISSKATRATVFVNSRYTDIRIRRVRVRLNRRSVKSVHSRMLAADPTPRLLVLNSMPLGWRRQ